MLVSPIVEKKLADLIASLTKEEMHIIDYSLTQCAHLGDDSATDHLSSELAYLMTDRTPGEGLDIAYHVVHSWKRRTP